MVWISVSLVLWTSERTFILDKMHSRLFSVPFFLHRWNKSLLRTMIKLLSLMYRIEFHERKKNAVYRLQISALVPGIFVFIKYVKYANEMTNDVIHLTQYYMTYINRAILANLHHRPLKLGRLIVLQETHLWLQKIMFQW